MMDRLRVCAVLAAIPLLHAATAAASPVRLSASAARPAPRLGVMADVGVPDGATASLVVRPLRPLRLHGGVGYNGISHGVRAGVTLVPLASWISPTLSLSAGRYFEGDANPLVRRITQDPMFSSPLLERVGYDYADAHVGLELGRTWFTFYLHAGMSRIRGQVHQLATVTGGASITFSDDPSVQLTTVSARLGFVFYFFR